jgi:ABC-type transport system involved in cytochrome c biogenesis permease subunit
MTWGLEAVIVGLAALVVAAGALMAGPVARLRGPAGSVPAAPGERRARLGRWLLSLGALVGLIAMVAATVQRGVDTYCSTVTAVAGMLTFAAFWSVALAPPASQAQASYGLLAAGAMMGYLLAPRHLAAVAALRDASYGLSGWSYVAGAGVLVAGLAHTSLRRRSEPREVPAGPYLSLATLCLTVSLAAQGAASQWAWGSYWVGDPAEYLRLIGWIGVALGWVVATEFGRHPRAVAWSLRAAAGVVIVVLLGSTALIQALDLASLYLTG